MKELSIEEKAKAYDKAIERANSLLGNNQLGDAWIYKLLPELQESEDERIRKYLINYVKNAGVGNSLFDSVNTRESILTWLEKQGEPTDINPSEFDLRLNKLLRQFETLPKEELADSLSFYLNVVQNDGTYREEKQCEQKSADKIEPKFNFNVGQWIVATGKCVYLIAKIDGFNVTLVNTNGDKYVFDASSLDDAHEWTIQDAKDGDVLASEDKDKVFIYNGKLDLRGRVCAYCGIYKTYDGLRFTECAIGNYFTYKEPHPATKEQRDILMKAMADAGYTFDFEKKELKKIEQKPTDNQFTPEQASILDKHIDEFLEQKHTWSEEDEKNSLDIKCLIGSYRAGDAEYRLDSWIDNLKSRVQPKQEWSEEDKEIVEALNDYVKNLDILFSEIKIGDKDILSKEFREKVQLWLESLRPQSQWRPSRDQMNALDIAIRCGIQLGSWEEKALKSLREQLFKL